jgi:competence protein ComEA
MTKQHLPRETSSRALEGSSALLPSVRGRSSAPHLSIWLPVVLKVLAAALAAVVLAVIGAKAGAHVPASSPATLTGNNSVRLPPPRPPDPDEAATAQPGVDGGVEPGSAVLADGRIVLNLASEVELTQLPGIGPSRARAILALRQRLTRFRAVEDLLRVKGIGRKTLRRLRPSVVLDRPPVDQHSEPAVMPRPPPGADLRVN